MIFVNQSLQLTLLRSCIVAWLRRFLRPTSYVLRPFFMFFHAYDIRGTTAEGLNAGFAERLGGAVAETVRPKKVLIGRDMRSSSPELEEALIKGLIDQGVHVTRMGLCSTPLFNVAMGLSDHAYDLGVMITASHNPAAYNGFKFTDASVYPIGLGSGLEKIQERFESKKAFAPTGKRGTISEDTGMLSRYLDLITSFVSSSILPPMKIAIDAGNGMAGFVLPSFAKLLSQMEIIPLYWEMDGTFPNHEANPLKTETLRALSQTVREKECALGVAYDGDADRIGFVDEHGETIPGDLMEAVLARALLRAHPGSLILRDLRSSWAVEEEITAAGGRTEMTRVGHSFIKRQLRESDALFAGELSMHYYHQSLWGVESGDLTLLLLLKELTETGKTLSELWKPLQRYAYSGEVNISVADASVVLDTVKRQYIVSASSVSELDGIRMEFSVTEGKKNQNSWWFSLRASNTEPLVRLIVEAVDSKIMEAKRDEIVRMIKGS
jgi:phosphomannomutase